jgi:hypothetical protein
MQSQAPPSGPAHTNSHQPHSADTCALIRCCSLLQISELFTSISEPDWLVVDASQSEQEVHQQVGMPEDLKVTEVYA